jgi:hypothetical protein
MQARSTTALTLHQQKTCRPAETVNPQDPALRQEDRAQGCLGRAVVAG